MIPDWRRTAALAACALLAGATGAISGCAAKPLPRSMKTDYDVIVIGAGMGGLSSAVHLANAGMRVLIIDKHVKVGGCTTSFDREEFKFDSSLRAMCLGGGKNGVLRTILKQAGVYDKIELLRIKRPARSLFPGLDFDHPDGFPEFVAALKKRWPREEKNISRFFELVVKVNQEVTSLRDLYLSNPLAAMFKKLTIPFRQRNLFKYRNHTIKKLLDEFFTDPQLKAVIGQHWLYYGPPPSKQWAMMYLVASYSYWLHGSYQIKGSSQALADAYQERIKELGGVVKTKTLVTKILLDDDDRVLGVQVLGGKRYTSRYVVSNADPYQTYHKLIGKDRAPKKMLKKLADMKPSNSLAGVYLGLDVTPDHWGLKDYEIWLNPGYDEDAMYRSMLKGDYANGVLSITMYGNLGDPFYAPPGKSVVMIETYSSFDKWPRKRAAYGKKKQAMVDQLIDLAEKVLPGLRKHIVVIEGMTPRTIQRYTLSHKGIPYGWSSTPEQSDRLSLKTEFGGLYMAGSWVWPTHGVAMAQLSGYLASRLILKREGRLPRKARKLPRNGEQKASRSNPDSSPAPLTPNPSHRALTPNTAPKGTHTIPSPKGEAQ